MSEPNSASLNRASWLRRVLQVNCADEEFQVEYSSRSLVHERILVNEQVEIETRISSWFRPVFRFFVGSRPAVLAVRVSPWLTIRSFHLLIDEQVLYCDRRRELFDGEGPRRSNPGEANRSVSAFDGPKDLFCPYCDRPVRGVGQDFAALPAEWLRTDSPIGRPTAVFSFARQHRLALIAAGILATVFAIALLAALWLVPFGNVGVDTLGRHGMHILGFLLLGVGPVAVFYGLRNRRLFAATGSEGIALIENDTVSSCRWENIETVHETRVPGEIHSSIQASVRGEDHFFQVKCRDGTVLVFRNFLDNLAWLGKIIEHETLHYLLPSAVAALQASEQVTFGPLSLDSEGLRSGREKRLFWQEVDDVKITKGFLNVMRVGKRWPWFKTPLGQVPNVHVLLALVQLCSEEEACEDGGGMPSV